MFQVAVKAKRQEQREGRDRLCSAKTPFGGFRCNVTLLHPHSPVGPASVFFLNVADFKGVQTGWHFG
jgi:hypothetical protein